MGLKKNPILNYFGSYWSKMLKSYDYSIETGDENTAQVHNGRESPCINVKPMWFCVFLCDNTDTFYHLSCTLVTTSNKTSHNCVRLIWDVSIYTSWQAIAYSVYQDTRLTYLVPATRVLTCVSSSGKRRAMPKSAILGIHLSSSRMLLALMSRWMIHLCESSWR